MPSWPMSRETPSSVSRSLAFPNGLPTSCSSSRTPDLPARRAPLDPDSIQRIEARSAEPAPDPTADASRVDGPCVEFREFAPVHQGVAQDRRGVTREEAQVVVEPVHGAADEFGASLQRVHRAGQRALPAFRPPHDLLTCEATRSRALARAFFRSALALRASRCSAQMPCETAPFPSSFPPSSTTLPACSHHAHTTFMGYLQARWLTLGPGKRLPRSGLSRKRAWGKP